MTRRTLIVLSLLALYCAIVLLPLLLATMQGLPRRPFLDELSSALAMVAFAMLLVEFTLSGRIKQVSDPIGIDITMRFHQLAARTVVVFLLLHPFLYTLPENRNYPWEFTGQYTQGLTPASTVSGIAAWLLLGILVFWAIARDHLPYRYETWRLLHALGALLIAIFGLHHTLVAGRYSGDPYLTAFWSIATIIAVLCLAKTYILVPLRQASSPYQLSKVEKAADKTWRLELQPTTAHHMIYQAGQFVWLKFFKPWARLTDHPFSISSAPSQGETIEFLIKENGDFTSQIGQLKLGLPAYLDGPHGNVLLEKGGKGVALIAGGVGLAPLMSLLREHYLTKDPRPVVLIYGNRVESQIAFRDELEEITDERPDIKIHHVLSEPPPGWQGLQGLVDLETLNNCLPVRDRQDWQYYICGPAEMIDAVENNLTSMGVPLRNIISERFRYDTGVWTPRKALIVYAWLGAGLVGLIASLVFAA